MRRKKICVRPKLNDRGGDLQQRWYVELYMRNPQTDVMERKRYFELDELNINKFKTAEERYSEANKIIERLDKKIDAGWNIFKDITRVIYEDQLQYSHAASIFKKQFSENCTYTYWIGEYIKEKFCDLSDETITTYSSRYRRFGLFLESKELHKLDIKVVDNNVIIEFFKYLKLERGLAARTYRSYIDLLTTFFDWLQNRGEIPKNPIYNLPNNTKKVDEGAERIRKEHARKLMREFDKHDKQLAMVCRFEYYCGLRPGYEVRFLKVRDIDFRKGYGRVRVCIENSKGSARREVTVPDVFLDYLIEEGINKYPGDYYVFSRNGQPGEIKLGKNNFRFRFNDFRTKLKLPYEYKLYSWKHTGAVTLAEEGEKTINIRDHLGHTSIQTTENYLKRHGFHDTKIIRKKFPQI